METPSANQSNTTTIQQQQMARVQPNVDTRVKTEDVMSTSDKVFADFGLEKDVLLVSPAFAVTKIGHL